MLKKLWFYYKKMNKFGSFDTCGCRSHFTLTKLQPKTQIEKIVDNKFRNVKTQTDTEVCGEQQIADLLSEIADLEERYQKISIELHDTKNSIKKSDESLRESKLKNQEEMVKLMEKNVELEACLSKAKMEFYEEKQKLISQINELQMEMLVKKEEEAQKNTDLKNNKLLLEERLENVVSDLKQMHNQNEALQAKLFKYKHRIRYLTKFMKQNILCDQPKDVTEKEKTIQNESQERCVPNTPETVSCSNTQNENKKPTSARIPSPDIESIVLSELFFKPKQIAKFDTIYL